MIRTSITTFIANEEIPAGARVKLVSGSAVRVELADAADVEIGTAILHSGKSSYAVDTEVGVALLTHPGTRTCLAAGAFAVGATVKRMADGKVDDTGAGDNFGIALEASAADLDLVEVLWLPSALATPADGAVTIAKLASETAATIISTSIEADNADPADGTALVTGQVLDAAGDPLAGSFLVLVASSTTALGAPSDRGDVTAAANSLIVTEYVADALILVRTHTDGSWGLVFDVTADETTHFTASIGGKTAVTSLAVTGND
jgi:hypothetical protein